MKTEAKAAALAAYDIEQACIGEMKAYFDEEQFGKAVELLAGAERIGASGCGHSGIICQHAFYFAGGGGAWRDRISAERRRYGICFPRRENEGASSYS